jgi:four helix bundle protein
MNETRFAEKNILKRHMESGTSRCDAGITSQAKEGFERTHLQEKIQFYNVARGSAGEVRSLLYVVSDNFTDATEKAERLRDDVTRVGKLVTGLLNSTVRRRGIVPRAILAVLSPISYLLTSISFHLR